jgi:hypothetical protein
LIDSTKQKSKQKLRRESSVFLLILNLFHHHHRSVTFEMQRPDLATLLTRGVVSSFVIALSLTLTALFAIGSYDFFRNVESNKCQMTWMFNYPVFTVSTLSF